MKKMITGKESYAKAVLFNNFIDYTLPPGRPQGPAGPLFASKNFRAAVPDLTCAVDDLLITGEKVTARLRFTGHFTGTFMQHAGNGAAVDFFAIDILHIREGKIVEDWHLEDNLALLHQLGVVKL